MIGMKKEREGGVCVCVCVCGGGGMESDKQREGGRKRGIHREIERVREGMRGRERKGKTDAKIEIEII